MLCHAMPRLSLVWFPPFFWLEGLSVWDYKAVKGVNKRSCPFVQHFQRCKPSVEHCLPSDPPSSSTTKMSNPAVSLHHELPIKELTKLWWLMVSFLCEQNQLRCESEGLKHSYNACGTGLTFMGSTGAWWDNSVYRCKEEKMMSSELWACKATPDGPRIIRWFSLAQSETVDLLSQARTWW